MSRFLPRLFFSRLRLAAPAALYLVALGLITAVSLVVLKGLDEDRLLEDTKQRDFMRNATFQVADNVLFELYSLFSSLSPNLKTRHYLSASLDLPEIENGVAQFLSTARFPKILGEITCCERDQNGIDQYIGLESGLWRTMPRPNWYPQILTARSSASATYSRSRFDLPVFYTEFRPSDAPNRGLQSLAVRINTTELFSTIVPSFITQAFGETDGHAAYRVAVIPSPGNNSSIPDGYDLLVPLLNPASFESWGDHYLFRTPALFTMRISNNTEVWGDFKFAAAPPESRSQWYLAIERAPAGLHVYNHAQKLKNAIIALVAFIMLAGPATVVYLSNRRMRQTARLQQQFSAVVSHELRTPLASVYSLAQNLAGGHVGTPKIAEYGAVLVAESKRLVSIVDNLLILTTFHQEATIGLEAFDLLPLVKEGMERFATAAQSKGVRLLLNQTTPLPLVIANRTAVAAAIDNLMSNALQHGSDGLDANRIEINVGIARRLLRAGVKLSIRDFGPGIRSAEKRLIFRPFTKGSHATKDQIPGGGVGLSLIKTIAQTLGGDVRIEETIGPGATFSLWLPGSRP